MSISIDFSLVDSENQLQAANTPACQRRCYPSAVQVDALPPIKTWCLPGDFLGIVLINFLYSMITSTVSTYPLRQDCSRDAGLPLLDYFIAPYIVASLGGHGFLRM
jgi:hypothetical protein